MSNITPEIIASTASDDDLLTLICGELEQLLADERQAEDRFVAKLRKLPQGLRAMAATYDLDISIMCDDLGWHFGNWHHLGLAQETAAGLEELDALEMADIFRKAFLLARDYWKELGSDGWSKWYHQSELEKAMSPLNHRAWDIRESKKMGLFDYWIDYARKYPERLQSPGTNP